jgi:hypothetical protein
MPITSHVAGLTAPRAALRYTLENPDRGATPMRSGVHLHGIGTRAKSSFRPQSRRVTKARALVFEDRTPSLAVGFIIKQEGWSRDSVRALQQFYLCDGFYPIEAQNVMHAGLLFALQLARHGYGPKGRCTKLDLHSEFKPHSATVEAVIGCPIGRETCRFTVLVKGHDEPGAGASRVPCVISRVMCVVLAGDSATRRA